jgi:hypothetical protein
MRPSRDPLQFEPLGPIRIGSAFGRRPTLLPLALDPLSPIPVDERCEAGAETSDDERAPERRGGRDLDGTAATCLPGSAGR